jgi:p-methyltransferase
MSRLRVVVVGHVVPEPRAIALPRNERAARNLLRFRNFTRVATDDGRLVEHLAFLREQSGLPGNGKFSIWEMYLCSALLLGSWLARHGFDVEVVNYIDSDTQQERFARLRSFDPAVVVLSTTFLLSRGDLLAATGLLRRELPNAFIVAGGHHVFTALLHMNETQRREYLLDSGIDAFVRETQGESALLDLMRALPNNLATVPNLIWRTPDGRVVENPQRPEQNDINATLIDFDQVAEGAVVHVRTARSCAFKCAFCSYPTIAGNLALMDLDNVITTLRKCKDHAVDSVIFIDDTFNVPRERFEILVDRMIAEGLSIPWFAFLRCQFVDQPLVAKIARSGCRGVFLGVESGSDKILKNMKKGSAARSYRNGIRWLRDEGIVTCGSFIIGFPGETDDTVEQTQEFIERSGLQYYFIQPFYYLHHTPVHKNAAKYGLTGNGLLWSHDTMDAPAATAHVNRLFREIRNSVWVNPDYTLWEVAYLQSRGYSLEAVDAYRRSVNERTVAQMERYSLS